MPRKVAAKAKSPVLFLPFELGRDSVQSVFSCVVCHPVYSLFICSSLTAAYWILSSQKIQKKLASFPYDRLITQFKSQKMITVYATLVEVVLELLMTVVLAGVSIIITMWLVFEEMADRKNFRLTVPEDKLGEMDSESLNVYRNSAPSENSVNL